MRLTFISNLYPPHYLGGYELLCALVAERLVARGHEVDVIASTHGASGSETIGGVAVRRVLALQPPFGDPPNSSRGERIAVARRNAAIVADAIAASNPEVVFLWSQLRLTPGPAQAAEASGAPVLYTFNDDHFAGFLPRRFALAPKALLRFVADRTVHRRATVAGLALANVTCISRTLKDDLVARGLPIACADVLHQGIPIERFQCRDDPGALRDPMRVLYAGQLHEYKGVHTLVEAAAALAAVRGFRRFAVTIAGDGPEAYRRRLAQAAGDAQISLLGKVEPAAMPSLYAAHDVLVFPSIWREPFGLTFLEGMATGCVVVATAAGGQRECLEHERNALIFAPGDASALASALRRLAGDEALSRRLARAGREMVETDFTLDRYVDRLEALLTRVAGERSRCGARGAISRSAAGERRG